MRRKRPLKESLDENTNGPSSSKRIRLVDPEPRQTQPEESISSSSSRRSRNRNRNQRTRQRVSRRLEEFEDRDGNNLVLLRGKRSSEIHDTGVDENDISELTSQFKRARLRPVIFTISTFIEQTVDDIQITVGEGEDENSYSHEGNNGEAHATFTFRLHPPRLPQLQEYTAGSGPEADETSSST